ncbi:hypothetical protein A2U01_0055193, partial [Trifolium medium]|nr:hypothetical protein [Trifolium medium]
MLSMVGGALWQPGNYSPYKHGVEAYGRNMTDIIGVAAYGGWHKICHAIMPWRKFDNTKIAIIMRYTL